MRVYGGCIEPGGMELADETDAVDCPDCGKLALYRYWEQVDGGSLNSYHTIDCDQCGHHSGNDWLMPY